MFILEKHYISPHGNVIILMLQQKSASVKDTITCNDARQKMMFQDSGTNHFLFFVLMSKGFISKYGMEINTSNRPVIFEPGHGKTCFMP